MALNYIDGFDHYTTATGAGNHLYERDPENWVFNLNGGNTGSDTHFVTDTMPELGTRGLRFHWCRHSTNDSAAQNLLVLPRTYSSGDTIGIGFYFYMSTLPNDAQIGGLIGLGQATTTQRSLKIDTTGVLHYWQGGMPPSGEGQNGSSLINSGVTLSPNTLYHVEWKSFLHATTGTVEVRLNGQTIMSGSNLDTIGAGFNYLKFCIALEVNSGANPSRTNTNPVFFDNLYIYDGTGSVNNNFLGERNVTTLFPDADLPPQDWVLSSGSNAFDLINDVPSNPLVDYIEAAADGDESRFGLSPLPVTDILINGIRIAAQAYKTGTTNTDLATGISINSQEDTSLFSLTQDSPKTLNKIIEVSPDGGAPLTPADIENMEVILRRTDSP